jgi:short-subunit dehydrogenase involved in D-alanine esterification of teichoic acids
MTSPLYTKALVFGATSGIGEALAAKLISQGTSVIVVGRRQAKLDQFVQTHGSEKATAIAFDVTNLAEIPSFTRSALAAHPDIDCVVINAGIQRAFDFTKPESVDLNEVGLETTTNYTSAVHLTTAFLPHLKNLGRPGHIVYVSATLGLIPFLIRTPIYNATKAALHSFIMAVRQQLKEDPTEAYKNVHLVEVFPPAVQTELHDEKHQPDLVDGGAIGMPLAEFTDKMYEGLVKGDEQFAIGPGEALLAEDGWESQRQKLFQVQNKAIQQGLSKHLKR